MSTLNTVEKTKMDTNTRVRKVGFANDVMEKVGRI